MVPDRSRISRQAKVFVVATVAFCALLAPVKSFAQTNQPVVMICANQYPGHTMLNIDLAAKTVSDSISRNNPHAITQITDQQIVWTYSDGEIFRTYTLDRYTGELTVSDTVNGNPNAPVTSTCQIAQKKF
ncbi:MAG TPA: hypothetical protein VMD53_18000 [Rhizomicrobium sp.]|nr:hypothetical protein [Rhizomicrobium sp.]